MKMKRSGYANQTTWMDIKDEVHKIWGKISTDELENTEGEMEAIDWLIEQKYFGTSAIYREKLATIFKKNLKQKRMKSY